MPTNGPMLLPVSSVNSSMMPTPGTDSLTSADACASTLMNVLTSKVAPPQVPASLVCELRISIDGNMVDEGSSDAGTTLPAVPGAAAITVPAQSKAPRPDLT